AEIRARERTTGRHMPIIAMTAHAMKGDRERCLEAGMDEYLAKPVQSRKLLEVIDIVLSKPAAAPGVAPQTPREEKEEPIYDPSKILEQVGGDEATFDELVDVFL